MTCVDEVLGRDTVQRLSAELWEDNNRVFCTGIGTALDTANVRRGFRLITSKAGIGEDWTPRELRHSFVSITSDSGVPLEAIADLVRHAGTAVTEKVYQHRLRPVITQGTEAMNTIFGRSRSG
ncbi:hypothetical protein GCM10009527_083020 [Actinomadura nitritigenes]